MKPGYVRHKHTYSFRAWIDERGSNADREHQRHCNAQGYECFHLELWDLNTNVGSRNIVRIVRRRRPFCLHIVVGQRYRNLLNIGGDFL
jgi:hypothetical protein